SDILEGTANYAEVMASVIAAHGCQLPETQLLEIVSSNLEHIVNLPLKADILKELFTEYLKTGYQIEGYEIGFLSLFALRSRGVLVGENEYAMGRDFAAEVQAAPTHGDKMKVMTDLQTAVDRVKTPVELLLDSTTSITD